MKDRRELLKGLAVGSVWATPVVSGVVLPVHANTSGGGSASCSGATLTLDSCSPSSGSVQNGIPASASFSIFPPPEGDIGCDVAIRVECDGVPDEFETRTRTIFSSKFSENFIDYGRCPAGTLLIRATLVGSDSAQECSWIIEN